MNPSLINPPPPCLTDGIRSVCWHPVFFPAKHGAVRCDQTSPLWLHLSNEPCSRSCFFISASELGWSSHSFYLLIWCCRNSFLEKSFSPLHHVQGEVSPRLSEHADVKMAASKEKHQSAPCKFCLKAVEVFLWTPLWFGSWGKEQTKTGKIVYVIEHYQQWENDAFVLTPDNGVLCWTCILVHFRFRSTPKGNVETKKFLLNISVICQLCLRK